MPAVDIQVLEGVFTSEEKAQLISEVTAGFGRVAGDEMAQNTSVRIHEIKSGDWGYGGAPLTTQFGLDLRARG